jgi:hypothetical protein
MSPRCGWGLKPMWRARFDIGCLWGAKGRKLWAKINWHIEVLLQYARLTEEVSD